MDSHTCLIERSRVREILIAAPEVNNDATRDLLAEVDKLPIVTLRDAEEAVERLQAMVDSLKLQARCHAQEARTANGTIAEAYQAVTGKRGEPGNWNGAEPVKAELERLRTAVDGWKLTALAMRDLAIEWHNGGGDQYEPIERLYFDAAMFGQFASR